MQVFPWIPRDSFFRFRTKIYWINTTSSWRWTSKNKIKIKVIVFFIFRFDDIQISRRDRDFNLSSHLLTKQYRKCISYFFFATTQMFAGIEMGLEYIFILLFRRGWFLMWPSSMEMHLDHIFQITYPFGWFQDLGQLSRARYWISKNWEDYGFGICVSASSEAEKRYGQTNKKQTFFFCMIFNWNKTNYIRYPNFSAPQSHRESYSIPNCDHSLIFTKKKYPIWDNNQMKLVSYFWETSIKKLQIDIVRGFGHRKLLFSLTAPMCSVYGI